MLVKARPSQAVFRVTWNQPVAAQQPECSISSCPVLRVHSPHSVYHLWVIWVWILVFSDRVSLSLLSSQGGCSVWGHETALRLPGLLSSQNQLSNGSHGYQRTDPWPLESVPAQEHHAEPGTQLIKFTITTELNTTCCFWNNLWDNWIIGIIFVSLFAVWF